MKEAANSAAESSQTIKRRASFSKEDRELLRDWMAIAARRAAADQLGRRD
jgi:hypothetical protein